MSSYNQIRSQSGGTPLDIIVEAAQEAGDILVKYFRKGLNASRKGRGNFQSEADLLSEKKILEILTEEFPGCAFISEESFQKFSPGPGLTFIIDPLDGTNNYCFGLPYFCVNIALMQSNEIKLALVHDPLHGETFWAEKGKGAHLNKETIFVSDRTSLQKSLLGFDFGYNAKRCKEVLAVVRDFSSRAHSFRAQGSSSLGLCYVASGRMDLYFHRYLYPWDIAPGLLLVREAGGMITDWDGIDAGPENSQIIAGNPKIHRQFMKWLRGHPVQ